MSEIIGNGIFVCGNSGGGGSANILSGTDAPTASVGSDGDVYLRYYGFTEDSVPSNYTKLVYIKNGNVGSYFNTGYHGNNNSVYKMRFQLDKIQTSQYPSPFGGRYYRGALGSCSYPIFYNGSVMLSWGNNEYPQAYGNLGVQGLQNKLLDFELKAGSAKLIIDGTDTEEYTFIPSTVEDTANMGIFTGIFGNQYDNGFSCNHMRMFRFEIFENDTLIHKYIPCLDVNNVPCLYDTVSETTLYNAGSGNFTYEEEGEIMSARLKVNGTWQDLIGSNINDANIGN